MGNSKKRLINVSHPQIIIIISLCASTAPVTAITAKKEEVLQTPGIPRQHPGSPTRLESNAPRNDRRKTKQAQQPIQRVLTSEMHVQGTQTEKDVHTLSSI